MKIKPDTQTLSKAVIYYLTFNKLISTCFLQLKCVSPSNQLGSSDFLASPLHRRDVLRRYISYLKSLSLSQTETECDT